MDKTRDSSRWSFIQFGSELLMTDVHEHQLKLKLDDLVYKMYSFTILFHLDRC